jgi:hypothetical protein
LIDEPFVRAFVRSTLEKLLAIGVFVGALVWISFVARHMPDMEVWPVALATLAAAGVASLVGAVWWRPLMYCGVPTAWLAMAVLLIERAVHFSLGAGFAVGLWLLANILAGVAAAFHLVAITGDAKHRTLLFHALFVVWPATGLLFIERGAALDLNRWAVVGVWLLLSLVGLLAHLVVLGRFVEQPTPTQSADRIR